MTSRTEEQQASREGQQARIQGLLHKYWARARLGLAIGGGVAAPFVLACVLAINRGSGREVAAWGISAALMLATGLGMSIWISRRDYANSRWNDKAR